MSGLHDDGIYKIDPDGLGEFRVYCDMQTDRGGWTVFQRRQDGSVDFYLGWADYKAGFGNLSGEFWLGLDKLHRLTPSGQNHTLRIDLTNFYQEEAFAKYENFSISSETDKYRLNIGNFTGKCWVNLKKTSNNSMFNNKLK